MRHFATAFVLAAAFLAASSASAEDMDGNVNFLVGQRYMSDDLWKPLDRPTVFGVEADFAPSSSPVRVALGWQAAGESGSATVADPFLGETGSVDSSFFEFSAGFLWHPVKKAIARPYLGAGAVLMLAANDTFWDVFDDQGDSDQSFGFYGNAGIFFKVGDTFNIGLDGRIVRGTSVTLGGREFNADYEQVSMLFGFSWGGGGAPHPSEPTPTEEPEDDD